MTRDREEPRRLEVCVETVTDALVAEAGGAARLELCTALAVGGVTPSPGLLHETLAAVRIPIVVLTRPRRGDFLYDAADFAVLERDVRYARDAGAAGVATGVLTRDGRIDVERCKALVAAAAPLSVTFHRAFDLARDQDEALDALVALGFERVLTSGGAADVERGAEALRRLVARAGAAITVMPGGGVRSSNADELLRTTGARELHASASTDRASAMESAPTAPALGSAQAADERVRRVTSIEEVRALAAALADADS
ncbi:MAG: copper homeostasis protein CutC [bacterium]|nr:copper homeostasis protein CutC [bacterium]